MSEFASDAEKETEQGDFDVLFELVEKHREEGNFVAVENLLNRAFEVGDEESVLYAVEELVEYYEETGQEEKAAVFYDKVKDSQSHHAAATVASVFKNLDSLDKAVAWLKEAFAFSDEFVDKWDYSREIAELYIELGNEEEAGRWSAYSRDDFDGSSESVSFDEQSRRLVVDVTDERTQEALRPLMEQLRREDEAKADFEKRWKRHRAMVGASAGEASAMASLADLLQPDAPQLAREWREKAALAGDIVSMIKMGSIAESEDGLDSAVRWWGRAFEAGDGRASVIIAKRFEGEGDTTRAIQWLVAGAESGHLGAVDALTVLLGKLPDLENASVWQAKLAGIKSERDAHRKKLVTGAETGDAESMYLLGKVHQEENPEKARTLFLQAAEGGNVAAMLELGWAARVIDEDLDAAAVWYQRAAADGSSEGYLSLSAVFMEDGKIEMSRSFLEKAADMGSSRAMDGLAKLFFQEGNIEACDEWISRAIAAGKAGG